MKPHDLHETSAKIGLIVYPMQEETWESTCPRDEEPGEYRITKDHSTSSSPVVPQAPPRPR